MPLPQPDVTVERPTTEEALAEVSARLGPGAEIVSAQRVARGGIGGFFAREMVQIVARGSAPEPEPPATRPGITGVLDRLATAADDQEARFQDVLRRELAGQLMDRALSPRSHGEHPAAQPSGEEGAGPGTVPRDLLHPDRPAPPGMGRPAWSTAALAALGLPARLVDAAARLHPADDAAWIQRLAAAAAPLLGPLPEGPMRLGGPGADRLATVLGAPPGPPAGQSLHLVLGGGAWTAGGAVPAAVSWVSDGGIAEALRVADGSGCPLAFGSTGGFPVDIVRLSPVDVALAVRRLIGRT